MHLFLSSLPSTFAETGSDKDPGVGTGEGWAVTFFQSNKPISIFLLHDREVVVGLWLDKFGRLSDTFTIAT